MRASRSKGAAERVVEVVAALCLGAAFGMAIFKLVPLAGGALAVAALAGFGAAAVAGFAVLVAFDGAGFATPVFDPLEFSVDEPLLLDAPLAPLDADSRVVRLFVPGPGEMAARIDRFIETGEQVPPGGNGAGPVDASAALHAALAEIRRVLH